MLASGLRGLAAFALCYARLSNAFAPGGTYAFTQWALDDDLLQTVSAALAAHGGSEVALPPAPPPMRFSDPDECRRALQSAGFRDVGVARIDLQWWTDRAEALLDLIDSGAVRAALRLEAQEPAPRARVHQAIIAAAETRRAGRDIILRRPAVLAFGKKES